MWLLFKRLIHSSSDWASFINARFQKIVPPPAGGANLLVYEHVMKLEKNPFLNP